MSVIWLRGNQKRGVKMESYINVYCTSAGLARPGVVGFYEQQPGHWGRKFLATPSALAAPRRVWHISFSEFISTLYTHKRLVYTSECVCVLKV